MKSLKKFSDLDIEQNHLDKISKIKLKSELLNNSINVLHLLISITIIQQKHTDHLWDYKAQIKRLVTFEKLLCKTK